MSSLPRALQQLCFSGVRQSQFPREGKKHFQVYLHTNTHSLTQEHTHSRRNTHTYTQSHTHRHKGTHTLSPSHNFRHTPTHTHTCAHPPTHNHTNTHTHTSARLSTCLGSKKKISRRENKIVMTKNVSFGKFFL